MDKRVVKLQEVMDRAIDAIKVRGGNFVYPDEWKSDFGYLLDPICRYRLAQGTPACIIGEMYPDFNLNEGVSASEALSDYVSLSKKAIYFVNYLQGLQDAGKTWLYAFNEAAKYIQSRFGNLYDE
jgi:hypothetical protein